MLDSYELSQPVIYTILKKSLQDSKISHAYLFESNGSKEAYDMALSFAKAILCPNKYCNFDNCKTCIQCKKIERSEFSELVIIEPDGLWIKKEQMDHVQRLFETKGIESKNRVYIVNHAERMNTAAANSILKFLEEPEEGIIAILVVDNRYQLLDTICSRCQIIRFKVNGSYNSSILREMLNLSCMDNISDEELEIKFNSVLKFIYSYEENGKDVLLHMDKLFHNIFNTKDLVLFALNIMILYYRDVIANVYNVSSILFNNELLRNQGMYDKNSLNKIICKINVIMNKKKLIAYNVNTNLFMDKLILELEEGV